MKRVVAIIQARMGSTRLPGKVLMDVGGKSVLAHLIDRLRRVPSIHQIVVATTVESRDSAIVEHCEKLGIQWCRGSETDVLGRYLEAARLFKADVIFRATSDEPYKDPDVIETALKVHLKEEIDCTCNHLPWTFPEGTFIDIVNYSVLEKAGRLARDPQEREHVTAYIYKRPREFRIQNVEAQGKLRRPDLRYCLDTPQDLQVIQAIFKGLGHQTYYFSMREIIDFLDQNEEIRNINRY